MPNIENNKEVVALTPEFTNDTAVLGEQAGALVLSAAPYLSVSQNEVARWLDNDSSSVINGIRFFKLSSCTTEDVDDMAAYLKERMDKLFVAIHSLKVPVAYGIVSNNGCSNLVIGVGSKEAYEVVEPLLNGLLTGIELTPYAPELASTATAGGIVSAVPVVQIEDDKQTFDISTLMRSLNGQNYAVLIIAKPYSLEWVQKRYGKLVDIRDKCFAVSKKNLARQKSITNTDTHTDTKTNSGSFGVMVGGMGGAFMGGVNASYSYSKGVSDAVSKAVGTSDTVSHDIQNGLALEMMEYCDKAIARLREGQNMGMWATALAYSAEKPMTANILKACLCGELAKPANDILPLRDFTYQLKDQQILIPKLDDENNPLLAPITSSELGMICTPPFESVPDFELKKGKVYPMVAASSGGIAVGKVSDGQRPLNKMNFCLSEDDLNKHTFVCGITGSGKTTTVKGILSKCNKPFMVIESAKKEYRNISLPDGRESPVVYTLGKPELNCLQFNPFYVSCGINLQTHIDYLKDLFNASFSFYGPMPYILEKCLHNIYKNKGWNLTLGYHPYLVNTKNQVKVFDSEYMQKQYALESHKYLFPTMKDLKAEVKRYIDHEMQYDGEVGGNVKTAMLARLESLCVGGKGFMLNTHEPIPMEQLMKKNVVFELEGLADDSDKAFGVGLLVVFINEYRQIFKERHPNEKLGLQHLLVIEEAHRLLKNVETERSSENMGNPKGKAVEHFTNMIAEMRSYGQGVIIAEQIPSKLAPDVIKNSSNKIIQRVVSADDQSLVANTIGIKEEDAVYLGSLKTGVALCHKEGMSLPVCVFVDDVKDNSVTDELLGTRREGKMFEDINSSLIRENLDSVIDGLSLKLLNTLMATSDEQVINGIKLCRERMDKELLKKNVSLVFCRNKYELLGAILAENVMSLLINGVYRINSLISKELYNCLMHLCKKAMIEDVVKVKELLKRAYMQEPKSRAVLIISELIKLEYDKTVNLRASINQYFFAENENLVEEISLAVKKE